MFAQLYSHFYHQQRKKELPLHYSIMDTAALPVFSVFPSVSIAMLSLYNCRAAHTTADAKCSKTLV